MLIFDAHLDLSMNAMEWNRDLRKSVHSLRAEERGLTDKRGRENWNRGLSGHAPRQDWHLRWHTDWPVCPTGESHSRLEFPGTGLGPYSKPTGLVPRNGARRGNRHC